MSEFQLPISTEKLIPHRMKMMFVKTLEVYNENFAETTLYLEDSNFFLGTDSQLSPVALIEFLAQLSAAHSGYEDLLNAGSFKTGFLVGISDFQFYQSVTHKSVLKLHIEKEMEFEPVTYVSGKIHCENTLVAEGTLKLWEQDMNFDKDKHTVFYHKKVLPEKSFDPEPYINNSILDLSTLNKAILSRIYSLSIGEDGLSAKLEACFDRRFIGFNGHFPGHPVLAGVIMLHTATLLSRIILKKPLVLRILKQAKFGKLISPDDLIQIEIKIKTKDDNVMINTLFKKENDVCAKFSFILD